MMAQQAKVVNDMQRSGTQVLQRTGQLRLGVRIELITIAWMTIEAGIAIVTGYAGIFPPEAPTPTIDQLRDEWERAIAEDGAMALVAEIGPDVVGTVHVRPDPDFPGSGQLRRLNVLPSRWGEGIGGRLHDESLQLLTDADFAIAGLWVLEANGRARAMYERRGWSLVPGATLEWPNLGVVEVRYGRTLRTTT